MISGIGTEESKLMLRHALLSSVYLAGMYLPDAYAVSISTSLSTAAWMPSGFLPPAVAKWG